MSECIHTCWSFEGNIRKNFPLLILFYFMNFYNIWIKYVSTSKWNIVLNFFLSFNAYWCSKSTLSKSWRGRCILGWRIVRLVRYIGSYGISPFSLPIEISSVSPKKNWLNHQKFGAWSAIRSIFGRGSRLLLSIRIIYGWLGWTNKMKYPGSVYKKPNW